jgi:hypothetical protein
MTLLAATSQHLYVGFNNSVRGVVLYRTANTLAASITDFSGRSGCTARHPDSGQGTKKAQERVDPVDRRSSSR